MDRITRRREQTRLRVKKNRTIKKVLQELNTSSSSNEFSDDSPPAKNAKDDKPMIEENTDARPSTSGENVDNVDDVDSLNNDSDTNQEQMSSTYSSVETEYYFSSNISSSDEEGDLNDDVPFLPEEIKDLNEENIQEIRQWAIKNRIPLTHLDELLKILRARLLPTLPKTAKTFLKTVDTRYNIEEMADANEGIGEFIYFGIESSLQECVNVDLHNDKILELQFNVDPVPLTKSGTQQFIPILCKIHYDPDIYQVFPVAIYHGKAKVKNPEIFLEKFVEEINKLQTEGIIIENENFSVRLKCFICDTPARSFLKNTLGHGGKYCCERCEVEGHRVNNRMVYPSTDSNERTTESFANRSQAQHHHPGPSPLLRIIRINIISCFILDFMHLCCIGITKKLLEYWLSGNLNFRLGRRSRQELGKRMESLYKQVPCEFQRKPRSTHYVGKWKATEFRFFLLYAAPIVLKHILEDNLYDHFSLFFVACRILCSKILCNQYTVHAKEYLRSFFIAMKDFYGPESQIINAHNLIHLADDVVNMGCSLSRVTAFPFESYLGKMKKWLRTPNRPLSQLCRRFHEQRCLKNKKPSLPSVLQILEEKENNVRKIKFKEVTISNSSPDNMVLLEDNTVVMVTKMFGNLTNLQFEGQIWEKKKPLFMYPTDSSQLKVWELQEKPTHETLSYHVNSISSKLVKLSLNLKENKPKRTFVIPLLH